MRKWFDKGRLYLFRLVFCSFLLWRFILYLINVARLERLLVLFSIPVIAFGYSYFNQKPLPKSFSQMSILSIPPGASFQQIADSLIKLDLLEHKSFFLLLGKISGKETNMHAGVFGVPKGLSSWDLLNYLENTTALQKKITFPEGILSQQMAGIAKSRLGIDSAKFVSLVYDSAFANTLVPGASNLEGYLLPETYYFEWNISAKEIIKHLVLQTATLLKKDTVQKRIAELGKTPLEILTMASIIEGEAVVDSERVIISSLYYNRLRLRWPMQADPTIQFIVPGPPRRLTNKDMEIDSPYNTYKRRGLPPGPINNPGKKSILAALFPANSHYLYMVAKGDGSHKFSRTLKEHNYWHAKFNEVRRMVRRRKRNMRNGTGQ